jgi:hypothetical protein
MQWPVRSFCIIFEFGQVSVGARAAYITWILQSLTFMENKYPDHLFVQLHQAISQIMFHLEKLESCLS